MAFLRVAKPDTSSLPPVLDVELSDGQQSSNIASLQREGECAARLGREGIQSHINAMLGPIERAYGKKPIIYGNDFVLENILTPEITQKVGLWRVKIGLAADAPAPPWILWQYTENAMI